MAELKDIDAIIIEMYSNPLTGRKDDYYGRIVNIASVGADTLIARAIANGFNGNAASIKAAFAAVEAEAIKAILRGEIVNYGFGFVALDVEGAFTGDNPSWNPATNRLVARLTLSKKLRNMLKTIPVRIRGMAPDSSAINSVTDVATGAVNKRLTPGGIANLRGARIKIVGDADGLGLRLTNRDTQEVVVIPPTAIGVNEPSRISFVVPASLAAGSYLLSVVTQFTGNSTPLKHPRTVALSYVLAVD